MRVISHIDNDAFYCQVEVRRDPERLAGQPVVVIQYNPFGDLSTLRPDEDRIKPDSNGSIIAVSYEARKFGVKRNMMAQQAKKLCPALRIVQVPVAHGKADLTIYRDAGAAVLSVLSKSGVCERASIDEAYVDVTAAAQQLLAETKQQQQQQRGGLVSSTNNSNSSGAGGGHEDPTAAAAAAAGEAATGAAAADSALPASSGEQQQQLEVDDGQQGDLQLLPRPESFEGWHVAGVDPEGGEAVRDWWCRPASSWTPSDLLLAAGALVVARARAAVKAQLGYSCSAGIAHSKILAKLGSGLHKPAQQTVVPAAKVSGLLAPLPLPKLRQLGGKFGEEVMAKLSVSTVGELVAVPLARLEAALGVQDAAWLHRLAQGKDGEEVKPRKLPNSISCGKTFRRQNVLTSLTAVHTWLLQLAQELQERIEADRQQHQRLPKLLTVSIDAAPVEGEAGACSDAAATAAAAAGAGQSAAGTGSSAAAAAAAAESSGRGQAPPAQSWRAGATNVSRSCALRHARADTIAADALGLVKKWARDRPNGFRIVTMFISVSNFSLAPTGASTLARYFTAPPAATAGGKATASTASAAATAAAAPAATTAARPAGGTATHQGGSSSSPAQRHSSSEAICGPGTGQVLTASGAAASCAADLGQHTGVDKPANSTQHVSLKRVAEQQAVQGRHRKAARTDGRQQGDLRAFFAGPAAAAAAASGVSAGSSGLAAAAAGGGGDMAVNGHVGDSMLLQAASDSGGALLAHEEVSDADCSADALDASGTAQGAGGGGGGGGGTAAAAAEQRQSTRPVKPALPALSALWPASATAEGQSNLALSALSSLPTDAAPAAEASAAQQGGEPSQVVASLQAWLGGTQQQQQQEPYHCPSQQQQLTHSHQQQHQSVTRPAAHTSGVDSHEHQLLHDLEQQEQQQEQRQMEQQEDHQQQHQQEDEEQQPAANNQSSWQQPQHMQLADIDPDVLAALPWDLQMEVQQQLRANRNGGARSSSGMPGRGRRGRGGSSSGSRGGASSSSGSRRQQVPAAASIHKFFKK